MLKYKNGIPVIESTLRIGDNTGYMQFKLKGEQVYYCTEKEDAEEGSARNISDSSPKDEFHSQQKPHLLN